MRQDGNGRGTVPPWGDAQQPARFAVGDVVYSGQSRGTVVGATADLISVAWDDGDGRYGPVTYPMEADYLRKGLPWES